MSNSRRSEDAEAEGGCRYCSVCQVARKTSHHDAPTEKATAAPTHSHNINNMFMFFSHSSRPTPRVAFRSLLRAWVCQARVHSALGRQRRR
jgi:hypothetical protein